MYPRPVQTDRVVCPRRLILSEIGEEANDVIGDLQEMIHRIYGKGMSIGLGNLDAGTYYL